MPVSPNHIVITKANVTFQSHNLFKRIPALGATGISASLKYHPSSFLWHHALTVFSSSISYPRFRFHFINLLWKCERSSEWCPKNYPVLSPWFLFWGVFFQIICNSYLFFLAISWKGRYSLFFLPLPMHSYGEWVCTSVFLSWVLQH